jgi:hypothetical protein
MRERVRGQVPVGHRAAGVRCTPSLRCAAGEPPADGLVALDRRIDVEQVCHSQSFVDSL